MVASTCPRCRPTGFTVVEMLVGVALIGVLAVLGAPLVLKTIHTAKMNSIGLDGNVAVRRAKSEAVKLNVPAVVRADLGRNELVAFLDVHGTAQTDPPEGVFGPVPDVPTNTTDRELLRMPLPAGITFRAPPDEFPSPMVIDGFTTVGSEQVAIFETEGRVRNIGGFRFGDERGNYLELRIEPAATARVTLRKWNPVLGEWKEQGEDGEKWLWY